MSVPTRGLSDMLDALTGEHQDDENKSKIHVTDEVQMHRLAASSAGSSSSLCLPGLPSASVATNFAQDQQNTWKMLMDMQQQMISFQTGLMRALETATVAATAARGAADAAQGSGRPSGPSGPPEPASVPNVRFGQSTNRIHPIKELHDEALKYFEKQALLHERNVLKLVRTQKEIDRLTSVISAMEQSKYNELKFIYPPGTSPFKAPSDVAEMNEALQESLENDYVLSFYDSKRHEQKKRDEHQPPREQHLHPKSDTTGSECSSGLRQNIILETGFPCVMREPQVQTTRMAGLGLGGRGTTRS